MTTFTRWTWSFLGLWTLLMTLGCSQAAPHKVERVADAPAADTPAAGTPAAVEPVTLTLADYDALMQLVKLQRGKVVVVDAWSTSCEPCMKEFPHLVELSHKFADRVACISVSLDYEGIGQPEEQQTKVLKFLRAKDARLDNLLASEDSDTMLRKLGVASMPAVFVFDRQGQRAEIFDKPGFTYRDVETRVVELLADR